jgi:threonine aldolase
MRFLSDNTASVCPEIMAALAQANVATDKAYDGDPWSQRLNAVFSDFFETQVEVYAVSTGTAANSLALSVVCPPFGAVLCHREAHIEVDECGAPEFYTGGAKLILCEGAGAKVTPESAAVALAPMRGDVHQVQPRVLSITQATELGRSYTAAEVAALSAFAKQHGLSLHMDGARFANALVHLGCTPADITWRAGVDVLSFGATKNGALAAEAVVFFKPGLAGEFGYRRKRGGHLLSKGRYLAAQLLAYVETGVWHRNARAANAGAAAIAHAAAARLLHPCEANEVFVKFAPGEAEALRAQGFCFYDWGDAGSGDARFVVSWDQQREDVEALCAALRRLG